MSVVRVIKNRVLEMFTEDNGKLSLSRVLSALVVLAPIVWVSYIVFYKGLPLPDLTGPAVFVGGGATHYGLGKWFGKNDVPAIPGALNANSAPPNVTLTPGTEFPKKN